MLQVSNSVGASKKTLSVSVRYGPLFSTPPLDAAAETGKEVVLSCKVDSNPAASIVWLQEGTDKVTNFSAIHEHVVI